MKKQKQNKLVWHSGVPDIDGMYWFDNGLRIGDYVDDDQHLILHVLNGESTCFGAGGSMPLDMVYHPKNKEAAKYAAIPLPTKWQPLSCIKKEGTTTWVKSLQGYIGFGIFHPDCNGVCGSCAWLTDPQCAFGSGFWWRENDGYLFCPEEYQTRITK
jgi:hypothetical protein